MQTDNFIGIDLGSSSLKAVAFEAGSGRPLAMSGTALPHRRLADGGCDLSGESIHGALLAVLSEVASQLGARSASTRAIGCTGHGGGLFALDARGALIGGRCVASTDQRAGARARALSSQQGDRLFQEVGCRPWAGQPTLIAAALFEADSAALGEIRHLMFAKDYLGFLLTGEIATDASDASTAGLLDLESGDWSRTAFDSVGLPDLARTLPPLLPSGAVVGRLRGEVAGRCGLPPGLPVAMGAIDLLASMTAVGAAESGHAVSVFGTWCVNAVIAAVRRPAPPVEAIVAYGRPGHRLYMENSPSSMANIAWLARTLAFADAGAVIDCAMAQPLGANGLRFLPFVNGGSTPRGASAGFVGLESRHTRDDMARAVVESVAALHAIHLDRLARCGLAPRGLTVLGGGARDRRLVQLMASLTGRPVERCGDDETGARGAAVYAARSQGLGGNDDGVLPAPRETVEPMPCAGARHIDFLADFTGLIDTMAPVFTRLCGRAR